MKLIIYLNAQGHDFIVHNASYPDSPLSLAEAKKIHPVIAQVVAANDQDSVIAALNALNGVIEKDVAKVNSYFFKNNEKVHKYDYIIKDSDIHLVIKHLHALYIGHDKFHKREGAHYDSLEKMIQFVEGSDRFPDNRLCTIL